MGDIHSWANTGVALATLGLLVKLIYNDLHDIKADIADLRDTLIEHLRDHSNLSE